MKRLAIGMIASGTLLFLAGVFDVFDLGWRNRNPQDYFIWFGIPVALMGNGLLVFELYRQSYGQGGRPSNKPDAGDVK